MGERFAGGGEQSVEHPLLARRRHPQELRGDRLGARAFLVEQGGGEAVADAAAGGRDRLVDGRGDERVDEGEDLAGGLEHAGAGELVGGDRGGARVELGERRGPVEPRPAGEHRHGLRQRDGRRREPREALAGQGREALGGALPHPLGRRRVGVAAFGVEAGDDLVDVVRVAAGPGVAGGGEVVVDGAVPEPRRQVGGARGVETLRPEQRRRRLGADRVERRRAGGRVAASHSDREQHRQVLEPPRQVGEPVERGAVGPLRVVDDQRHRPALGEVGDQPVEAVAGLLVEHHLLVAEDAERVRGGTLEQAIAAARRPPQRRPARAAGGRSRSPRRARAPRHALAALSRRRRSRHRRARPAAPSCRPRLHLRRRRSGRPHASPSRAADSAASSRSRPISGDEARPSVGIKAASLRLTPR